MTVFRISTPRDAAEMVAPLLGFHPTDSLVVINVGPHTYAARMDLPEQEVHWDAAIEVMLEASTKHETASAIILGYSVKPLTWAFLETVGERYQEAGIEVPGLLRVAGDRVYLNDEDDEGSHFDPDAHTTEYEVVASREAMAQRVAYSTTAVSPINFAVVDVTKPEVRDSILAGFTRGDHEGLSQWCEALRSVRNDDPLVPHVAAICAFKAFLEGDGGLSWVALDRSGRTRTALGDIVATLLESAANPNEWVDVMERLRELM